MFTIAIANEYVDYQRAGDSEASKALHWEEGYKDMWNTMIIPTALLLIARYSPGWMIGKSVQPQRVDASDDRAGETV
ncbi:hypothetical protein [Sphingorhabdus sp. Alg231-15]|uniref:hypothetical protein n=1 Tax=Sphingorhabdus sp. Alg231-15 TaxID=1922222 RepID=UPI00307B3198